MMQIKLVPFVLMLFTFSISHANSDGVNLGIKMANLQYFVHKLGLSISGKNIPLAKFYAHETEEIIEQLLEIQSYNGEHYKVLPVARFVKSMLLPSFQNLKQVLNIKPNQAFNAYEQMLNQCNACHAVSGQDYIKIEFNANSPYLQTFTQ